MTSPSFMCVVLAAILFSVFIPKRDALVINYFDSPNGSPSNNSGMQLLHLDNYKKTIPAGFTDYGVGAYKFHKEPLTWGKAMKVCEGEGAHLAVINSKLEEDVLVFIFSKVPAAEIKGASGVDYAAIGVHDHFNEGEYLTVQGTPLDSTGFVHWGPGEPLGGIKENCVVMNRIGTLADSACHNLWTYICELN